MKGMAKSGGGSLQHHQKWKTQLRVGDGDRSAHEHELLCMTLELGGCYDQLDLSALAGMELVLRRLQLFEESKAAGGAACEGKSSVCGIAGREPCGAFFGSPCRQQAAGGGQRYEGKAQTY